MLSDRTDSRRPAIEVEQDIVARPPGFEAATLKQLALRRVYLRLEERRLAIGQNRHAAAEYEARMLDRSEDQADVVLQPAHSGVDEWADVTA